LEFWQQLRRKFDDNAQFRYYLFNSGFQYLSRISSFPTMCYKEKIVKEGGIQEVENLTFGIQSMATYFGYGWVNEVGQCVLT